jgi:hypothetical protein
LLKIKSDGTILLSEDIKNELKEIVVNIKTAFEKSN